MVYVTRWLDMIAATLLEVTMVYALVEFPDVILPTAGFWIFVVVTIHWLWRMSQVGKSALLPVIVWSRKQWRNLDLTLLVESVFSQVCYRKDG